MSTTSVAVHIPTKLASFSECWSPKIVASLCLLLTIAVGCKDKDSLSYFAADWLKGNPNRTANIDVIPSELEDRPAVENLVRFQWFDRDIGTPDVEYTLGEYGSINTISNSYGHIAAEAPHTHEDAATMRWHDLSLFLSYWPIDYQDISNEEYEFAITNYEDWIRSVLIQSSKSFQEAASADNTSVVYRSWIKSLWGTLSRGCEIYKLDEFTVIVFKGYEPPEGEHKKMHVDFIDETTVHRLLIEAETWQNAELLAKYAIAGYGYAPE